MTGLTRVNGEPYDPAADVRCPSCKNADVSMIEAVTMPLWTGVRKWLCNVCSKTWTTRSEVQ